ncbi:MAG: lactonase family protein [Bacillota bacterium]
MKYKHLVLIGSYSQPIQLGTGEIVPGNGEGITVFDMDNGGGLTILHTEHTPNPTYLALSADGRFLYAVNELKEYRQEASSTVSSFALNWETGKLTFSNRQMTGGENTCFLCISQDGRHLLVSNYSGGSHCCLPILPDGSLGKITCFFQHAGSGTVPGRQDEPHVHQSIPDCSGTRVLVADLGTDEVAVYGADWTYGWLIPNAAAPIRTQPGFGPRQMIFNGRGDRIYLIGELQNAVNTYAYDATCGVARLLQTVSTLPDGCKTPSTAACVKLHPSGALLYASNRGHDSLVVYRVLADGTLEASGIHPLGGKTPRDFDITPDGTQLLCALQDSDELVLFDIDPDMGTLSEVSRTPCRSATCVLFADAQA